MVLKHAETNTVIKQGGAYNMESGFLATVDFTNTAIGSLTDIGTVDIEYTIAGGSAASTSITDPKDEKLENGVLTFTLAPFYALVPSVGPRQVEDIKVVVTPISSTQVNAATSVSFSLVPWMRVPQLASKTALNVYREILLGQSNVFQNVTVPGMSLSPTLGWTGVPELFEDLQFQATTDANTPGTFTSTPLELFDPNVHSVFRFRNLSKSDLGIDEDGKSFSVKKASRTTLPEMYIFVQAKVTIQGVTATLLARLPNPFSITCACKPPNMGPLLTFRNPAFTPWEYYEQPGTPDSNANFDVTKGDSCIGTGDSRQDIPAMMSRKGRDAETMLVFVTRGVGSESDYFYIWWYYSDETWEKGAALVLKRYTFLFFTNTLYTMLWIDDQNKLGDPNLLPVAPLTIDQPNNAPYAYLNDVTNDICVKNAQKTTYNTLISHKCRRNRNRSGYTSYMRQERGPNGPDRCRTPGAGFVDGQGYSLFGCGVLRLADAADGKPMRLGCAIPRSPPTTV